MAEQYNSSFTGPEIDAILGGSVRYDLAQSLTAAQQAQARGNIDAAPGGYGLGGACVQIGTTSPDQIVANGWYQFGADNTRFPVSVGEMFVIKRITDNFTIQIVFSEDHVNTQMLVRKQTGGAWTPWEWVNPPLAAGVEYRTTERYKGKPIYIRLEEITALPNNSTLTVSNVGVPSDGTLYVDNIVDYRAEFYSNSAVYSIPYNDVVDVLQCNGSRYGGGITYSIRTKVDYSAYAARIWIKYTKQTD